MDVTLPFELVAVEAALAASAKTLESDAAELESKAEPSLVRLSQKVSRKELENVKNYKATLNRLIVRVTKVRTVCPHPSHKKFWSHDHHHCAVCHSMETTQRVALVCYMSCRRCMPLQRGMQTGKRLVRMLGTLAGH